MLSPSSCLSQGRKEAERRADDLEAQLAKKRDRIAQLKEALLRAKEVIGQQRAVRKRPSDLSTSSADSEQADSQEQKRRRKLGGPQGKSAGFTASPDRAESAASQALADAQDVQPSVEVCLALSPSPIALFRAHALSLPPLPSLSYRLHSVPCERARAASGFWPVA